VVTCREAGRLGGQTTVARLGRAHMQQIGRRGFQVAASAIERPGAGVITYDRRAGLLFKLYPAQFRRGGAA